MAAQQLQVKIKANTGQFVVQCRIIAKHLTALADELELAAHEDNEVEEDL